MLNNDENDNIDEIELDEGSAADTLKPGAGSGGGDTKVGLLSTFTSLLAQLGKEDLSNLYNRTLEQIGKEAASTPGSAESNRATVNAKASSAVGKGGAKAADPMVKLAIKEDVEELFSDDELSEELREKAITIFEAAINTRMNLETARLVEEYNSLVEEVHQEAAEAIAEAIEEIEEELQDNLDSYLNYVVEQWMENNEVAIESTLKAQISENFMIGLKNLFTEHYIEVPDEKLDIVSEMKAEIDVLKSKLEESTETVIELQNIVTEATKESLIDMVSEGLADTQVEKMRTLSEGIDYVDPESYRRKLEIVKENYFSAKKSSKKNTGFITEEIDGSVGDEVNETYVDPVMNVYSQAISKSLKL